MVMAVVIVVIIMIMMIVVSVVMAVFVFLVFSAFAAPFPVFVVREVTVPFLELPEKLLILIAQAFRIECCGLFLRGVRCCCFGNLGDSDTAAQYCNGRGNEQDFLFFHGCVPLGHNVC